VIELTSQRGLKKTYNQKIEIMENEAQLFSKIVKKNTGKQNITEVEAESK